MTGTLAQVQYSSRLTIRSQPIQYPLFVSGAGFYLDATNPKYALHYNMRTHIQFEIPQVLEIAGLPIVSSGIVSPNSS
jgi:S-formylglutathione hydrolase FrmB